MARGIALGPGENLGPRFLSISFSLLSSLLEDTLAAVGSLLKGLVLST
jgi:hypothetical protein